MKTIKTVFFLILFLLAIPLAIHAQKKVEITGKVIDEETLELIGCTITEKGTTNGTITDIDGFYKITVAEDATLEFNYLSMEPMDEKVNARTTINVTMRMSAIGLNEVVAIGYGTVRRGEITSSVASVQGKDIENLPVTNALQALSGRIAGLHISQASGAPGAESEVKIRGGISITQSNEPLYIIDGFESPDGLAGIEPWDVESIDVLKDASATAIYGAAGANGVILVTTKSGGKEEKATINFDTYIGFKKITKRLKTLSVSDFVKLEYERAIIKNTEDPQRTFVNNYGAGYNSALSPIDNMQNAWYDIPKYYDNRAGVNWQDEVFDSATPMTQNYRIGVSGGSKGTNFSASYSHTNDDGVMTGSGYEKNNVRLSLGHKINQHFYFSASASYLEDKIYGQGSLEDGGRFGGLRQIIQYRPILSRDRNDQELIDLLIDPMLEDMEGNVMINPTAAITGEEIDRKNKLTFVSGRLSYEPFKGLTFQVQGSLRKRNFKNDSFYHANSRQATRSEGPYAYLRKMTEDGWNYTNTVTYRPIFSKKHNINIMVGQEEKYRKYDNYSSFILGFSDDNHGLGALGLGTSATVPVTSVEGERDISFFGRINYDYMKKYLATFTYRADGSSKFGKAHKWGHFPSLSFAWRAIDEDFIRDLDIFSDFKARLGVGTAGNNNIQRYRSLVRMQSSTMPENNKEENAISNVQLANPNLKWETDVSINLGLEFGFFNQRLQAVVDIYQNTAKDLLLERQVPLISGYGSVLQNIGETQNRGIELALNSHNIETKDFTWTSSVNFTYNKNKIKKLTLADRMPVRANWAGGDYNDYDYLLEVGSALGHMWGWEIEGLYAVDDFNYDATKKEYILKEGIVKSIDNNVKPGYWKYKDINGDGLIDDKDKKTIGEANPKVYGGITNNLRYKDFDFSFIMNYSIGGNVYNANKMFFTKMDFDYVNSFNDVANRFTYYYCENQTY